MAVRSGPRAEHGGETATPERPAEVTIVAHDIGVADDLNLANRLASSLAGDHLGGNLRQLRLMEWLQLSLVEGKAIQHFAIRVGAG